MKQICGICAREKRSTIPSEALKQIGPEWCRAGGTMVAGFDEAECYRLGFERLGKLLNTPELHDFTKAVALEASHQRERWGSDHDGGKAPADWFWLVGYLAGKGLHAHAEGRSEKALHHTITAAAALANWHAAILGQTNMRPGIEPPAEGAA